MPVRAVLLLLIALLFYPSVKIRENTFGTVAITPLVSDPSYRSLTTLSTNMAHNWNRVSPWRSNFILQLNPATVESPIESPYTSYPPGFLLPAFVVSKLLMKRPTVGFMMALSLAYQLLLAFLMGLLALHLLGARGFGAWTALLPAVAAGALVIYLPSGLIFFQNVWWPDLVGTLPFALVIFLEITGRRGKLQLAVLALGLLTDWISYPLAAALLARRWWVGELGDSRQKIAQSIGVLVSPPFAFAFYLWFVWSTSNLQQQVDKTLSRIGVGSPAEETWLVRMGFFWQELQTKQFGWVGMALLSALAAFAFLRAWRPLRSSLVDIAFLVAAPIAAHWMILSQHYGSHPYNGVRFVMPFALLAPLLAAGLASARLPKALVAVLVPAAAAGYLVYTFPLFEGVWEQNISVKPEIYEQATYVRERAGLYRQVVFSPDLVIDPTADMRLPSSVNQEAYALAQREVHEAKSVEEIRAFIAKRQEFLKLTDPEKFEVVVFGLRANVVQMNYWKKLGEELEGAAHERFYLVRLAQSSYWSPPAAR
jgi:hypothetical protein